MSVQGVPAVRTPGVVIASLPCTFMWDSDLTRPFDLAGQIGWAELPVLDSDARRGVAQSGSAPVWGTGGRRFKSGRPDQSPPHETDSEAGVCPDA